MLSNEIIETIKDEVKNDKVWISTDETTDVRGRHVTNVLIGSLNPEKPNKSFLIVEKSFRKRIISTST